MVILVTALAGTLAAAALIGVLVREGFRNGDVDADVRVRARTLAAGDPGASGRWVEVTLTNPARRSPWWRSGCGARASRGRRPPRSGGPRPAGRG
jgi:hypothetical protein